MYACNNAELRLAVFAIRRWPVASEQYDGRNYTPDCRIKHTYSRVYARGMTDPSPPLQRSVKQASFRVLAYRVFSPSCKAVMSVSQMG